jgi:hypothetical protein
VPMKEPKPIEIEAAQVEQLIGKAEKGTLNAAEQRRLVPLLKTLLWLERTLLWTRISLAKLQRILFGKKTEKRRRKPKDLDEGESGDGNGSGGPAGSGTGRGEDPAAGNGPSARASHGAERRGHGRRAAAHYPGAEKSCARCRHTTRGRAAPTVDGVGFTARSH